MSHISAIKLSLSPNNSNRNIKVCLFHATWVPLLPWWNYSGEYCAMVNRFLLLVNIPTCLMQVWLTVFIVLMLMLLLTLTHWQNVPPSFLSADWHLSLFSETVVREPFQHHGQRPWAAYTITRLQSPVVGGRSKPSYCTALKQQAWNPINTE